MEITKTCTVESKKFLGCSMLKKTRVNWKKTENCENIFFKALVNRFRVISQLISRVKEQQNCLWTTFYQKDFIKR